jgi:hypothetical protein
VTSNRTQGGERWERCSSGIWKSWTNTHRLWEVVETAFADLGIQRGRQRRLVDLMVLYVVGLILLEKGQTA